MTPSLSGGAAKAPPVKTGAKPADPSMRPPEPKDPPGHKRQGALRSPPLKEKSPKKEEKGESPPRAASSGAGGATRPKLPDPMGSSSEEEGVSEHSSPKSRASNRSPRSPLVRRPHGTKQRKKFARGEYGDKVKFKNSIAQVVGEEPRETQASKGGGPAKGSNQGQKGKKGPRTSKKEKERAPRKEKESSRGSLELGRKEKRRSGIGEEKEAGVLRAPGGWQSLIQDFGESPAHLLSYTIRFLRVLVLVEGRVSESLRQLINSPNGSGGIGEQCKKDVLYPLPLEKRCAEGLKAMFHYNASNKERTRKLWQLCTEAWNGLVILGLNAAAGHCTQLVGTPNRIQKKALEGLSVDCVRFVLKGIKGEQVSAVKCPEVPWSSRLPNMSVSYSGEIVDKARWLTFAQVLPGLPPAGLGGSLSACEFCDPWVRRHLECPSLSRIPDCEVPLPLPHAVVRATQDHWNVIAKELVDRGIATVIPECDVATVNGEKVLNGAFGVVKPNRWVDGKPILRLIMDFRAANALHRSLPGSVESLVGPSKWQAICLEPNEVLVASGDDLVSCFYLFAIPYEWSKYFAFRKTVKRKVLGGPGDPEDDVFIASRVIPMGWSAAVSVGTCQDM